MQNLVRRSLLIQLLSVYLSFVIVVLLGGVLVDNVVEQRLRSDVQAADRALAQEIALRTRLQVSRPEQALVELGKLVGQQDANSQALEGMFQIFKATHSDVDQVFWLDPVGGVRVVWPAGKVGLGAEFSPPGVVQRALRATGPVLEVGIATATATRNAGVIIAEPVRNPDGSLKGILASSVSLVELSLPLQTVVQAQQQDGRHLMISVIDENGRLIATPDDQRILQTVLDELPGAEQALKGATSSRTGPGNDGQSWLFSAVPVPDVSWAVVVQRPAYEALAVVGEFRLWLLAAALLFALGGLLFWLLLLRRVIRPLHTLALQHQTLPTAERSLSRDRTVLAGREDEVGYLARSLISLEQDGLKKLAELQTLLETSNAVVRSLEPHTVVKKIIHEVRRLVDVQGAAILLPDEKEVLHVLVSEGHSEHYDTALALSPDKVSSAAVLALREGRPVQKLLGPDEASFSYDDGFRAVLAIPIISRHVGGVVLLVHRLEPHPFGQNEIDLLLTFANYATLAWEHAVLYERSDVRLQEVARENELLYRQASEEKQKLEAIMGSMSDGLLLTGSGGQILYANQAVGKITDLSLASLEQRPIEVLYTALARVALDGSNCQRLEQLARSDEAGETTVEIRRNQQRRFLHLRLFEVGDHAGQPVGRGLLMRDVTRERDLDEFKTTLLSAVGHELRTPLAVIKGHASTLLQEDVTWSPADQRHSLQMISAEADRVARLISNLLDLSRQEAGLLLLKSEAVNILDMTTRLVEQASRPGVHIRVEVPPDLPLVYADQARIEVVLHNLLSNAVVYGEGEVRVRARSEQGQVIVSVWDNGPGIDPDELPHIFERFYRARRGQHKHAGGTGLGLAICKAFIDAHRGHLWVENGVEEGITISFSLPLNVENSPVKPEGQALLIQEGKN
ncbi:MAG TPA: ATP-binding protein [Chloroflexia bacterium]|nr:ATP-binding protein [Chloroflexia bacterium]